MQQIFDILSLRHIWTLKAYIRENDLINHNGVCVIFTPPRTNQSEKHSVSFI